MSFNYTVKEGDTLPKIASKLKTNVDTLVLDNGIKNRDFVQVGQVLTTEIGDDDTGQKDLYESADAAASAVTDSVNEESSVTTETEERNRVQAEQVKARSLLSKAVKGPSQEEQTREETAQFKAVQRGDLKSRPLETREEVESAIATVSSYFGDGPDATALLREVVIKESNMGQNPNTYKMVTSKKFGRGRFGVAQVDEVSFNDTQARLRGDKGQPQGLVSQVEKIKNASGIDLLDVEYEDLRDPVLSAMYARLHFMKNSDPISDTVEGRAAAWKKHYNSKAGKGKPEQYTKDVRSYDKKWKQ